MKRLAIATAVVTLLSVAALDAVEFAGGYNGFPLVIGVFPASLLPFALGVVATLFAGAVILIAVFRRQMWCTVILLAVVTISWLLSPWFFARGAFLYGFATRLRQLSTPAEIELAAETCVSLMSRGGYVYGPSKFMGPPLEEAEQSQRVWEAIRKHAFVHLNDDTCVISVQPPNVTFEWGGALPGHWGICVANCRDDPERTQIIRFAEGISLFRGD